MCVTLYVISCVTYCVTVSCATHCVAHHIHNHTQHIKRGDTEAELLLPQELPLCGDVKVEVFHQARFGGKVQYVNLL